MEFVLVYKHPKSALCSTSYHSTTQSRQYIYIPDEFLVYMNCSSAEEFGRSIAHVSWTHDYKELLLRDKYCSVCGTLVFRHIHTAKTATIALLSQKSVVDDNIVSITTCKQILWQSDDEVCAFLGILEAKCRLGALTLKTIVRNDREFVPVPMTYFLKMKIADSLRHQLAFLSCEFNINVATEGTTRRCLLLPKTLLHKLADRICHKGPFSILYKSPTSPQPLHCYASEDQAAVFGLSTAGFTFQHFTEVFKEHHTAAELERIEREIMPIVWSMELEQICVRDIEFILPTGRKMFLVTFRLIRRHVLLCLFPILLGDAEVTT